VVSSSGIVRPPMTISMFSIFSSSFVL